MKKKMIYNFNEHGLYYDPALKSQNDKDKIVFAMDTLQLEFEYKNRRLLSIFGFLPLIKSIKKEIIIPDFTVEQFHIALDDFSYDKSIAYDFFGFFPNSKEDFINDGILNITYDDAAKRILIGDIQNVAKFVKIDDNIICGCHLNGELKSLIIQPDEVIK